MSTGIMWANKARTTMRHETALDELEKFEWLRHDGQHFGTQILDDQKLGVDITTSFVIPSNDMTCTEDIKPTWIQKISFNGRNIGETPFFYYFGMDCSEQDCLVNNQMSSLHVVDTIVENGKLVFAGHSSQTGWFGYTFSFPQTHGLRASYVSKDNTPLLELAHQLRYPSDARKKKAQSIYEPDGSLPNLVSGTAHSAAALLENISSGMDMYVSYVEHINANTLEEVKELLSRSTVDSMVNTWMAFYEEYRLAFETAFHAKFLSSLSSPIDNQTVEHAKICLSSLLGGIGYFQGSPSIGNGIDVSSNATDLATDRDSSLTHSTITLLTGTPSRAIFPRGFLWDEGFHQLVMVRWNPAITLQILQDWLNALHFFDDGVKDDQLGVVGWVPREMILGEAARRRVPDEFIDQRVNIANPPTFFLVIDHLLDSLPSSQQKSLILSSLHDLFPRLVAWLNGFLQTQQGLESHSFRWRGRSLGDKKNIPNTLASGLDDYPRSLLPAPEEKHLDLHCWMLKTALVLQRLHDILEAEGKLSLSPPAQHTLQLMDLPSRIRLLTQKLDAYHWSEQYQGFFDTGFNNESAVFISEVLFRCGNPETRQAIDGFIPVEYLQAQISFCPPAYPQPVGPVPDGGGGYHVRERLHAEGFALEAIPRVGYVSIFPLLLKLLPADSPKMESVLSMMEDPALLYSDFGLRSLATTDKFYGRKNSAVDEPYWR